mgnify:CR=1 FL=1
MEVSHSVHVFTTVVAAIALLIVAGPRIWYLSPLFLASNRIQWLIQNPLHYLFDQGHQHTERWPRLLFLGLVFTGIAPAYWMLAHTVLTPLRFLNAVYFNGAYLILNVRDSIVEVVHPLKRCYREASGKTYLRLWAVRFPMRLFFVVVQALMSSINTVIMIGVDTVWPVLTMFHGTPAGAQSIVNEGKWLVGGGEWIGRGVYFAIAEDVARGFEEQLGESLSDRDRRGLAVRVNLSFCRPFATLPRRTRGAGGLAISRSVRWPWAAVELHHRPGRFEYCLVHPVDVGSFIQTWRARPILGLRQGRIKRIDDGTSLFWPLRNAWMPALVAWSVILFVAGAVLRSLC